MDHNGFMLGAGGSAALPDWQPDRVKQAQRLRKWRNMLGAAHPPQLEQSVPHPPTQAVDTMFCLTTMVQCCLRGESACNRCA